MSLWTNRQVKVGSTTDVYREATKETKKTRPFNASKSIRKYSISNIMRKLLAITSMKTKSSTNYLYMNLLKIRVC